MDNTGRNFKVTGFADTQTFSYNADDSAMIVMKMNNGAMAMVDANFNIPDAAAKCRMEFYGTKGSIIATGTLSQVEGGEVQVLACPEVAGYDAQQDRSLVEPVSVEVEFGNMYQKEIEAFTKAVFEDTEPPVNAKNTLRVQEVIEAIYTANGGKFN